MMQKSETSVFTEKEAHQHEQSLEEIRSGRLGAFTVMMQIDSDIQEEMKRDPLCKSDLLADFGEALEARRRGTDLVETAVNRL